MATVKENLIAAKARIVDPNHWARGGGDCVTCFCAATTLNDIPNASDSWEALWNALPETEKIHRDFGRLSDVFRFNDDPGTTHADIMALFDRAIAAQDASP